mgnify:CR=1 FL=1
MVGVEAVYHEWVRKSLKLILCCEYRTCVDIGNMLINEMTDVD